VNTIIGETWKEAIHSVSKENLKELVLQNPELVDDLVTLYTNKAKQPYNFSEDRAGEYVWVLLHEK
jgi:hypothetical protein